MISALKHQLPSTRTAGEGRTIWTSFVKTRNARARSSHVSMIRRVTMELSNDLSIIGEGPFRGGDRPMSAYQSSFDCDWSLGTIWCGVEKLGSATHRQPKDDDVITIGAGWISVAAVARTVGCSTDDAKRGFEKEL